MKILNLTKNPKYHLKSKISPKIQNLTKNSKFYRKSKISQKKSKISQKIQNFTKNPKIHKKSKIFQKYKIFWKFLKIYKNQEFSSKLILNLLCKSLKHVLPHFPDYCNECFTFPDVIEQCALCRASGKKERRIRDKDYFWHF